MHDICVHIHATHYIYVCVCIHIYVYTHPLNNDIPVSLSSLSTCILVSRYPSSLKEQGNLEKMTVYGLSKGKNKLCFKYVVVSENKMVQKLRGSLLKRHRNLYNFIDKCHPNEFN